MSPELTVMAPCYNEEGNIRALVERLTKVFEKKNINGQIVLVNDCSTDNTAGVMAELEGEYSNLRCIHHEVNQGIEGGWRTGVKNADGEYVCLMDADMQNLPEDVYRLFREIKMTNADMVQGYRSSVGRLKDSRLTLSLGLNWMLNKAFGLGLKDCKSGFVIAPRPVMEDVLRHDKKYYYFQTFITASAKAKGYSIREVETLFESRLVGESFIDAFPLKTVFLCFVDLARGIREFRFSKKQENILSDYLKSHEPTREDEPLRGWRNFWYKVFINTMPLHKWLITKKADLYYQEFKKSQWLTPDQLIEVQNVKLQRLIEHAYSHVAYYRELMDAAGLKPSDIRKAEDLQKLPMLTKQHVRDNLYFDLLSDNHNKKEILKITTSGSTGEPFVCFADRHQLEIRWASTMRSAEWTGYRFGDRQARLWHQKIGMNWSQVVREKIDAWFMRRMFVPVFEMSEGNIGKTVTRLRRFNPVLIDGYAESFNILAKYVGKNAPGEFKKLSGIMSSAQELPEHSRSIIEDSFKCGVFDKYGSREFSGIAYECDHHKGHHVLSESYIVEIIKDGRPAKPGEVGEIVITDLNNLCMPFIRYRVGDLAEAMDNTEPCTCGRGLPRIGKIQGRVQAIIFTEEGKYVPGTFFAHFFKDYEHLVRQYQVIQEEDASITMKVIKGLQYTEEGFEGLMKELRVTMGKTPIEIEYVDEIPLVRTGKHQGSISRMKIEFQEVRHDA